MSLILTHQSLFMFNFLQFLIFTGNIYQEIIPDGPYFTCCIDNQLLYVCKHNSYCCLCHASLFLLKSLRVLCDFLQHFLAICCLLILRSNLSVSYPLRNLMAPNQCELLKSSHVVRETCQCACCAHWPDLGGVGRPNKMTDLPLLYPKPLGSHDTSETGFSTANS